MFNGKTKSVQYIIEKVFRDSGIAEGVDLYDCIATKFKIFDDKSDIDEVEEVFSKI